jgi:hypothetical protein
MSNAYLDLQALKVGTFLFDDLNWVSPGRLKLNGFEYERMERRKPGSDEEIQLSIAEAEYLGWLHLQENTPFFPQPFEQLAGVLRREGHVDVARQLSKQREREYGKQLHFSLRWILWYKTLGRIIGYGYEPLSGLWWLGGLLILGALVFWCADRYGLMIESGENQQLVQAGNAADMIGFSPLVYSFDVLAPFINMGQADNWRPKWHASHSRCIYWYYWAHRIIGWTLATLVVAGLTGLIRT